MSMSMYQASVPIFVQMLTGLSSVLDKAEAHCTEKKIDQSILLGSRLYPDMWALKKEVVAATDFARNTTAFLAGKQPLAIEENETSFADLRARIARTLAYVQGFKATDIDGSEGRSVTFKRGPQEVTMKGKDYLVGVSLPNFYFFCTTAYGILRHNGVELAKRDYLGKVPGT